MLTRNHMLLWIAGQHTDTCRVCSGTTNARVEFPSPSVRATCPLHLYCRGKDLFNFSQFWHINRCHCQCQYLNWRHNAGNRTQYRRMINLIKFGWSILTKWVASLWEITINMKVNLSTEICRRDLNSYKQSIDYRFISIHNWLHWLMATCYIMKQSLVDTWFARL